MLLSKESARQKAGFKKIHLTAQQALKDGLTHIWVDTCNIDKSSSAELSEAINSMYRWYQSAKVCYVHLTDFSGSLARSSRGSIRPNKENKDKLRSSRWFKRGWTLQELIAPAHVLFYSDDWEYIGTKEELIPLLTPLTEIPEHILRGGDVFQISLASRMSWAARRKTTRTEDKAYCLMGIFGVNMPMLYGEGNRAFQRLQEEILKISDDTSIFCWIDPGALKSTHRSMFARSPGEFEGCSRRPALVGDNSALFQMTNKGLKLELDLMPNPSHKEEFFASLGIIGNSHYGVYLRHIMGDRYIRIDVDNIWMRWLGNFSGVRWTICIPRNVEIPLPLDAARVGGYYIGGIPPQLSLIRACVAEKEVVLQKDGLLVCEGNGPVEEAVLTFGVVDELDETAEIRLDRETLDLFFRQKSGSLALPFMRKALITNTTINFQPFIYPTLLDDMLLLCIYISVKSA